MISRYGQIECARCCLLVLGCRATARMPMRVIRFAMCRRPAPGDSSASIRRSPRAPYYGISKYSASTGDPLPTASWV